VNTRRGGGGRHLQKLSCVIGRFVAEELAFQRRNHNARLKNVKVSTYCSTIKGHVTIVGFFVPNHAGPISRSANGEATTKTPCSRVLLEKLPVTAIFLNSVSLVRK
jgi:hypothetical protein